MKILSDKYDEAKAELDWLVECFHNVEIQVKKFDVALEQVTDGNEADLLVMEVGRIMDAHAKNIEDL